MDLDRAGDGIVARALSGRLHPATMLIGLLHGLRRSWSLFVFVAVGVHRADSVLEALVWWGVGAAFVAFLILVAVVEWVRFRWRLTSEVLEVTSGFASRQERRIPADRIQDLVITASMLHRALGLVAVSVQTSSTVKAEAVLDAITRAEADALQRALAARAPEGASRAAEGAPEAPLILRAPTAALVARGLTDNRAGLVVASALAVVDQAIGESSREVVRAARDSMSAYATYGASAWWIAGVGLVLGLCVVGYIASALLNVVTFHGFELRLDGDVFVRRHGLLTTRRQALPRHRIQALRIRQSPVRRLLGLATLQADDMGSSSDPETTKKIGADVFVPIARVEVLRALVPVAFPALLPSGVASLDALPWTAVSPRMIRRSGTTGLLAGLVLLAVALPLSLSLSLPLWPALVALPIAGAAIGWVYGRAAHATLRFALGDGLFAVRGGVLGHHEAYLPRERVQAVVARRSPLDRWHGVTTVVVIVGGGARMAIANVPAGEASLLATALAERPLDQRGARRARSSATASTMIAPTTTSWT
jgi:putative membrane protein